MCIRDRPIADGVYEYKFSYDNWAASEALVTGAVCTITSGGGNNNRLLIVSGSNIVLLTPPFGGCAESATNPGPHNLTVNVDMSGYGGTIGTAVNINGENYNSQGLGNWCGPCVPLADQGSNIWSITLPLEEFTYQFKITVDGWTDQESFTAGDAGTVTNGANTNRFIQMSGDKTINLVWNQPQTLSSDEISQFESTVVNNPTDTQWTIKTPNTRIKSVQIFNVLGKRVYSVSLDKNEIMIPAYNLSSGIYIAKIQTELGTKSIKLLRN